MIGQWEKLFTPSTPFLMTPGSGESIGLAALRIMQVFQANRSSTFVWRGIPKGETNPLSARARSSETKLSRRSALASCRSWVFRPEADPRKFSLPVQNLLIILGDSMKAARLDPYAAHRRSVAFAALQRSSTTCPRL
jgi:hypothetical protein